MAGGIVAQDRFYFWRGYYDAMEYLSDEETGMLFRAICAYAFDGEEPDFTDNRLMQVAWTMVADSVAESVDMGRRSSEAGKRGGGRPRKGVTKKGVKKGVKNPLKNTPENPPENVRYGNTLSANAERGNGASPAAPDGAALAPDEHVRAAETWYVEQGIDVPPAPAQPRVAD